MYGPGEMMRRAMYSRRLYAAVPGRKNEAGRTETANPIQTNPPSRYPSGHANYSALMRSHDRVHTRHLEGKY